MANAILDLIGTPTLVSLSTKNLVLGTSGAADLVFVTNGTERLRIDSAGQTTLAASIDFRLGNNDWLEARNAAGNADLLVLKADASDNTVINALTGKSILFEVNATDIGAIAAAGLIMGGTSAISGITSAPIEIQAAGSSVNALKIVGYSTVAADGPYIQIGRTKGAAAATNTIVASGDILGSIVFSGANGTSYSTAAEIRVTVDGTPGATNDMPGAITIYTTPDGSGTQLSRWKFAQGGGLEQTSTNTADIRFTGRLVQKLTPTDVDAQNNTLTIAQIAAGIVVHTSVTGGGTVTTDTALNIIAGSSSSGVLSANGDCIQVWYINDGDQTLTFAGGTDVTIADTGQTIANNESALLIFRRVSSTTVTMYMVGA